MPDRQDGDLKRLVDKDAIRDCLYKYCRGIDRADEILLRSTYWPDGTDDHGPGTPIGTLFPDDLVYSLGPIA